MNETIQYIVNRLYLLNEALNNASSDIEQIFSPGFKKIKHLSSDELCFKEFHREQFEETFLKDLFIRVSKIFNIAII